MKADSNYNIELVKGTKNCRGGFNGNCETLKFFWKKSCRKIFKTNNWKGSALDEIWNFYWFPSSVYHVIYKQLCMQGHSHKNLFLCAFELNCQNGKS